MMALVKQAKGQTGETPNKRSRKKGNK
jgi:hypothetical protein